MPPKKAKPKKAAETADATRICDLLSRIPLDSFVSMASNSGLTRDEVRELCDAVRKLNE